MHNQSEKNSAENSAVPCVLPEGLLPYQAMVKRAQRRKLSAKALEKRILRDLDLLRQEIAGEQAVLDSDLSLSLQVKWQASEQRFIGELRRQLSEALVDGKPVTPIREGHIYCHFCRSYECAHSIPKASEDIFLAYSERGIPRYGAFHQLLLDLRDERSELLFRPDAPLVTVFQYGRDLRKDQLALFGRKSTEYSLLGQVSLGYLRQAENKFALSLQMVKSGRMVLLNSVMAPEAASWWHEYRLTPEGRQVEAAIESIRREIRGIEKFAPEVRTSILKKIPALLRRLANDIEAVNRRRLRRTQHAVVRHSQRRPVALAYDDLQKAGPMQLFWDEKNNTWILWADKNRIHVFSPEAKLVTSLHLAKQAIERRITSSRWQPAAPGNLEQLKAQAVRGNILDS